MKQEKMIKIVIAIFLVVIVISLSLLISIDSHNKAKHNEAIVNGALVDLSLDRSDFTIIELKEFEGTNTFVLRLDERLFLGSYDEREDGIYVDVVKEI